MANKEPSMHDLIIETHVGLKRQGPGSPEMVEKALGFLDGLEKISKVADLGCGTGGQTMVLAENISGTITGIDICPDFIHVFNENAKKLELAERVHGVVGSIEELPFPKEELDLVWSEGVIDSIGFGKGINYWNEFLKKNGYLAVTCPSWLTDERPREIEKFWTDAVQGIDTVADNILTMQKAGYAFVASFVLPEECWLDHYFIPRNEAEETLVKKYGGSKVLEDYLEGEKYEIELLLQYKQYYGYVFYIGQKI